MKRKLIVGLISIIGLVIILVYIQGGFHSKIPPGNTPLMDNAKDSFKTAKVEVVKDTGSVTVSGTIGSRDLARIASRILGYVTDLKVKEGDEVTKEQTLLTIDTKEVSEKLDQAKANLESAKADLTKARNDYDRYRILMDKESISRKDFDDVTARYEIAKAAETRAEAAVEESRTMLSYGNITAPFSGIISDRNVNIGDLATPGKTLISLYTPGSLEVVAAVGEQYAGYLKVGSPVEVTISSINAKQSTSIREVVPQRDEKTRTITIKASLTETPGLNPGVYATLTFRTRESEALSIPVSSLIIIGQLETVKVLENGRPIVSNIKTGRKLPNDRIEVISGLNPGEEVIIPL